MKGVTREAKEKARSGGNRSERQERLTVKV
nr:MAG TPA: hypothetical protein [Caudoviricetes sp.]